MAPIVAVIAATSETMASTTETDVALTIRALSSVDYDAVARLTLIVEAESSMARMKERLDIKRVAGGKSTRRGGRQDGGTTGGGTRDGGATSAR
jgi:hypothetical protein